MPTPYTPPFAASPCTSTNRTQAEPTPSRKAPPFFTPNDTASNPIPQTRDLGADGETSAASGAKNLFKDARFTHTGGHEPEQAPDPATTAALPPLVILPNGAAFLQNQRLDAPASTVTETNTRLIASIFTTDCYEYTDLKLITWFRKNAQITAGEAPFFNTQALSKLMTKENPDMRAFDLPRSRRPTQDVCPDLSI
jgi:hypothetical protein